MLYKYLLFLWLFPAVFLAVGMPRLGHKQTINPPATIIDYLSSDAQYSYFLRHIQRHGLVPQINKMQNVTVFAPVNMAFVDPEAAFNDTKESLLRYFADQRFRVSYLNGSSTILESLLETKPSKPHNRTFPLKISRALEKGVPKGAYLVNNVAEILEFDAYVKHQHSFIQTIDHLIPLAVSMCDFLMDTSPGTNVVNGFEISLIKLVFQLAFSLRKPLKQVAPLTCEEFLSNASTALLPTDSYINSSLLEMEKRYFLTIHHGLQNPDLYPTKEAVREIRTDVLAFLLALFLPDLVGGINGTSADMSHSSVWGKNSYNASFDKQSDTVRLNGKVSSASGLTALPLSDGILHIFDWSTTDEEQASDFVSAWEIPRVDMVPRKTLYAMHFSQLVRELKFYKKASLISGSVSNQTMLVDASDRDDFFDEQEFGNNRRAKTNEMRAISGVSDGSEDSKTPEDSEIPEDLDDFDYAQDLSIDAFSFSTRQQILYKFMDGFLDMGQILSPETPRFHGLLESKLCLKKRIDSCFRVKVSGTFEEGQMKIYFNDKYEATPPIIASGNNSIYVLQKDFSVPDSFKNVMAQLISDGSTREHLDHVTIDKPSCLQTLRYLDTFALLLLKENYHGYTFFLPCGRPVWDGTETRHNRHYLSWNSLGLILKYLERNPGVFDRVLRGNILQDLIYSDFGLADNVELYRMVETLNKDHVNVSETYQQGEYNHVISVNQTAVPIPLNSDILFSQGVIHITQNVPLPSDFKVSVRDLIHAAHGATGGKGVFDGFLERFPKLLHLIHLDDHASSGYSLLVPTSDLLRSFNITSDYKRLLEFLELHIITNAEAETLIRCMGIPSFHPTNSTYTIKTNQTRGPFTCHTSHRNDKTWLTLAKKTSIFNSAANERNHQVRILNYGCTQGDVSNSSCVFLVERPLQLDWFDPQDNFLHVHIGWISVGIGIVIGVVLFGFCTTTVALCLSRQSKAKPAAALVRDLATPGSSYMPITSDEDLAPENYDHGYETDVDMMRSDTDPLLPKKGGRRHRENYRSASPIGAPSAPRKIKNLGILEAVGRDRDLPPVV